MISTNPPTKQIYEKIPWHHTAKPWGPTLEAEDGWTVHHVPLNNYVIECDGKHNQDQTTEDNIYLYLSNICDTHLCTMWVQGHTLTYEQRHTTINT